MDGFTVFDLAVAGIILLSAILAYARGLVRELSAILGWIAAAAMAFAFAGAVEPLVGEIPVVGPTLGDSCELGVIASFAIVFALSLVVLAFFTPLLSSWVRTSPLSGLDQGLGFLFGVLRGLVLVAVGFVVYDRAVVGDGIPEIADSRSALIYERAQGGIDANIPTDAPGWIMQRYEGLTGRCSV